MHEHVFVLDPDVQQNYPDEWGSEDDRVADAVTKLKALAAQGIRSIADPTVVGLGRYIPRIKHIADQVPELNIIAATGCYTYDQVPFFFYYRGPALVGGARRGGAGPDGRHVRRATSPRASPAPASRPPSSSAPSTTRA